MRLNRTYNTHVLLMTYRFDIYIYIYEYSRFFQPMLMTAVLILKTTTVLNIHSMLLKTKQTEGVFSK